ncbi:hypothetical protein JR316_0006272 [Psilocybe cubensis]|uniref:Uncharacterized protein n=1 Tax=Psilocybe cubensis TaxID=181762 RepID=A0ACB8H3H3_PSICU|nr:hypothetical protein JR316_0006272 [Psilocybe cubensis]KAH9481745.1 hypothetical protein JR316_0006272 [Psilocybe cubensis]
MSSIFSLNRRKKERKEQSREQSPGPSRCAGPVGSTLTMPTPEPHQHQHTQAQGHTTTLDATAFLQQEYKQWEKAHARMKDAPPADGHDYLKHAAGLLVLLESAGVGDTLLTKAVIECFKAAVMFEQDRRENDARVTAVFLAQTDVMRILLDVDDIANRRRNRLNADVLRSDATLNDILVSIQKEIKSCGNSIDTYYNESRFVKFWKSQDWKERILAHIEKFNKFRIELQQALSIQVASGVEDLVSKMDIVLARFFTPKHDWEKALDARTQQSNNNSGNNGSTNLWAGDTSTLQSLIALTQDPASIASDNAASPMAFAADMQLFKVKRELESSLDALCDRNMGKFEMKLSFHAQQMEQAIANSAQLVIQSLSGPSDRLANEDLKELWKEMDWIFCVDNKFFVSALFEFYLDRFSSKHAIPTGPIFKDGEPTSDAHQKGTLDWFKQMFAISVSAPKFSFLSKLGAINHPDAWTLEYIALHGEQITKTIDSDDSGFIRISEANAFAQQCPRGWSLPQWCAYSAAGWAYEARIYRRRISHLTFKLTEMQASVLPSNRGYLFLFSLLNFCTICHAFTREPTNQNVNTFAPELRELVKEKVLHQDELYREHLHSLKWTVEDESTIHLLYGEKDPEKFCTLILEQLLALSNVCRTATVDVREWIRLSAAFRVMREITVKRVSELSDIATYHGGIWSYVVHELDINKINTLSSDMFVPYTRQELAEALADRPILNDFPPTMTPLYLEFPTWEDYVKTLDPADVPSTIPRTWDPIDDTMFSHLMSRTEQADFPFTGWGCDRCRNIQTQERRHTCIQCPGQDFCRDCLTLEGNEYTPKHTPRHSYLLVCFIFMPEEQQRLNLEAENILEQLQQQYRAQQRSISGVGSKAKDSPEKEEEKPSLEGGVEENKQHEETQETVTSDEIPTKEESAVSDPAELPAVEEAKPPETLEESGEKEKSIEPNYYLCHKCQPERFEANENDHQWWHTLLCLRKDLITSPLSDPLPEVEPTKVEDEKQESEVAKEESTDENKPEDDPTAVLARISNIEDKLAVLDNIHSCNSALEQKVDKLEAKLDSVMAALETLLGNLPVREVA